MTWVRREADDEVGATLVEVLVALAIVAAASAMIATSWVRPNLAANVRLAVDDLASRMKSARSTAIGSGAPVTMMFDLAHRSYRVDDKTFVLPKDSKITLTSARRRGGDIADARITFYPDGSSSGAQFTIAVEGYRRGLSVDWLAGTVRVVEDP